VDIVVKGRSVEVPEHFRQHVSDKLRPSERLDGRVFRLDVELSHEKNPRQSALCQRVEITVHSKGPVIRAEACAETFYAALDAATLRLEARLRKSHDRRRVHHGSKNPPSVAQATAALPTDGQDRPAPAAPTDAAADDRQSDLPGSNGHLPAHAAEAVAVLERPADDTELLIVRDKTHTAQPMSVADALHEMELVGHDFFLFSCAETGLPSVVYRRHGYDYGVLRLAPA